VQHYSFRHDYAKYVCASRAANHGRLFELSSGMIVCRDWA
jgi:hypothetical protein